MHLPDLIKQKPSERIIYVLRRHPFTFVPQILLFLVLAAIPFLMYWFISNNSSDILVNPTYYALLVLGASVYYLSILLFLYTQFIIFYLDMSIVTNDRIVEVEQLGLFARTISELEMFRIQDVTSEVKGIFASIFHYGNVYVKTASDNNNIIMFDIHKPEEIREQLIELSHEARKHHIPEANDDNTGS